MNRKPGDSAGARAAAIEAAARGLLDARAVWDAACRWARGAATSSAEVFDGVLTREQLAELEHVLQSPRAEGNAPRAAPLPAALPLAAIPATEQKIAEVGTLSSGITASRLILGDIDEPRYILTTELGEGGVGRVVLGRDRAIGRTVALKMPKDSPMQLDATEHFLNEARVTAQLEHPNVVPVYDLGSLPNGQPYYTMRVVKQQSLQDVLASDELRRHWPLVRLVGAFVQISRALAYAHRRGVLHRDIKPENVLLGDFGEVYLADWGNAKPIASAREASFQVADGPREGDHEPSGLSGTPGYISPEQIRGDRLRIDHRSDIFALGVVLYEILTGEHPFEAPTVLGVILATQTRAPKPPRTIVPNCPLLLEDLCLAMLAKDPAQRPESADRVAAEAEAFLEGAKERARRREEARRLCELAKVPVQRGRALSRERDQLVADARRLLADAAHPLRELDGDGRVLPRRRAHALLLAHARHGRGLPGGAIPR